MIKFKKYRKLFVTLSILSYCGAPYSNIIQAMEQVKETSESKKLSIDLLKKILECENFTDTKKQEIIESSIVRLRRNIGIPKKRLKINVKDLPILFQYTVLETCNSLLESDNEFRNLIQRSYLENTNHQFEADYPASFSAYPASFLPWHMYNSHTTDNSSFCSFEGDQ